MRKFLTLTAAAAFAVAFGFGGTAYADDNADDVTAVTVGSGSNSSASDTSKAVDEVENTWYSLGHDGDITLQFTDNTAQDGPGADIRIRDRCGTWEDIDVAVSNDGVIFFDLDSTDTSETFDDGVPELTLGCDAGGGHQADLDIDLNGVLPFVTHVKITDQGEADFDTNFDGFDVEKVVALNNFDLGIGNITKTNTGRTDIEIQSKGGFDAQQFFTFDIRIVNSSGEDLTDIVFEDVLPAEFDLDPDGEETADGTDCPTDGVCDGVMVSAETEGGDCTATGAEHTNQGKSGKPFKLQPDIITITAAGLTAGQECTISVWAMTDQKALLSSIKKVHWTPTECNEDSFIFLNEGVEVIDTMGTSDPSDDVTRLVDDDQIQLTCTGP